MKKTFFYPLAFGAASFVFMTGAMAQDENSSEEKAPAKAPAKAEPVDEEEAGKAAKSEPLKVNGKEIPEAEIESYFQSRYGAQAAQVPPAQQAMFRDHAIKSVRRELVLRTLLLAEADKAKVEVSDKEVAEEFENIKKGLPEGATIDLYLQMANTTEEKLRKEIGEEMRISKVISGNTDGKSEKPTDEAVKAFYDENPDSFTKEESVSASHILISVEEGADDAAKKAAKEKIEGIRKELVDAGDKADFAAAAKEHSSCPSSAQGGSLGSFGKGQMVPEFEKAAFSQKVGTIGEVIETQFGYHLVKVDERTEAGKVPFDEVKKDIGEHLEQQAEGEVVQAYLEKLQNAAKVEGL